MGGSPDWKPDFRTKHRWAVTMPDSHRHRAQWGSRAWDTMGQPPRVLPTRGLCFRVTGI